MLARIEISGIKTPPVKHIPLKGKQMHKWAKCKDYPDTFLGQYGNDGFSNFNFFFIFRNRVSLFSLGWPVTHSIELADLRHIEIRLPLPPTSQPLSFGILIFLCQRKVCTRHSLWKYPDMLEKKPWDGQEQLHRDCENMRPTQHLHWLLLRNLDSKKMLHFLLFF